MTIKENIEQIQNNLDTAYLKLQELKYAEEFENYIRRNLLDIIDITEAFLNSVYLQETKEKINIKRQGRKG